MKLPRFQIREGLGFQQGGGIVAWGDETATIPNLSLTPVDLDATVGLQLPRQNAIQLASALRLRHDVDVIVESEETGLNEGLRAGPMQRAKALEDHLGGSRGCLQNRLPTNRMTDCRRTEGRKEAQSRLLGLSEGLPTSNLMK